MKIGEAVFCQQRAIEEYASAKAGIDGKTDLDQMKVEMVIETMNEIFFQGYKEALKMSAAIFPLVPATEAMRGIGRTMIGKMNKN